MYVDGKSEKSKLSFSSPYEIRFYNDQLLQLERAFINPLGQDADYTDYKYERMLFFYDLIFFRLFKAYYLCTC
jgi:hypothetical protein